MQPQAILFDLDGTIYLGDRVIEGAPNAVQRIRDAGIRVAFLTNKPLDSPEVYSAKLNGLGIPTSPEDIITSVSLTVSALAEYGLSQRVYVIGESYLKGCIEDAGHTEATEPSNTDVVVVSLDREMAYEKIHFAYQAITSGAHVVATNPDILCPIEGGEIVDAGAWIAALEALLRREITTVMGKPSRRCAEFAMRQLGRDPHETLMVGDRRETDGRMAIEVGMRSALVLSGVTSIEDFDRYAYRPEFTWESVADLPAALDL